jgi:hypothetical protein
LPDLQRVAGLGAAAQTAGTMQAASAQPSLGNPIGPIGGVFGSPQPGFGIHPAVLQQLMQLRAAGFL